MSDANELDIKKVLEQGTQRVTLKDLAERGHEHVKVLDEEAVHNMIAQAVDRVVNLTSGQRDKLLADSRRELDRLMREHREVRSRAGLLESNKNELIERVEQLQRELQLKSDLEEETLHRRVNEGLASLKSQVDELRRQKQAAAQELDAAVAEVDTLEKGNTRLVSDRDRVQKEAEAALARVVALEKELSDQQSKARGAEKARTDLVAQVLKLQSQTEGREQELKTLRADAERLRVEASRLSQGANETGAEKARLENRLAEEVHGRQEAQRSLTTERERSAESERRIEEARRRIGEVEAEADRLRVENSRLGAGKDEARAEASQLEKRLAEESRGREQAAQAATQEREHRASAEREAQKMRQELEGRLEDEERGREQASNALAAEREKRVSAERELEEVRNERGAAHTEVDRLQKEIERLGHGVEALGLERQQQEKRISEAQDQLQDVREKLEKATEESERHRAESGRFARSAEQARAEKAQLESRLAGERIEREAAVREIEKLRKDVDVSTSEVSRLEQGAEKTRADHAGVEERLAEARKEAQENAADVERLRGELSRAEERLTEEITAAAGEKNARHAAAEEADRLRFEVSRLKEGLAGAEESGKTAREWLATEVARFESALAERERAAAEAKKLEAVTRARIEELEGLQSGATKELEEKRDELSRVLLERDRLRKTAEAAREETAFVKGQLSQQQKEHEAARGQTAIVMADLQEIEEERKAELDEVDRLKADSDRLRKEGARLARELDSSRGEIQSLQEMLVREQESARVSQNHASTLQTQLAEFQARSAAVEKDLHAHRAENERLQERLEGMETILESARQSSTAAEAAALQSREATAQLQQTLAERLKPKERKPETSLEGGAAYDGMALLEGFLRKIRLKEHFQKYLPVQERPGQPHPSEMMVEVVKAIVAGEPAKLEEGQVAPLEIVGPSDAPDPEALRQFLGGLSPQAVRALAGVHHALRLHLTPLPKKPHALVLDVVAIELGKSGRSYRPLLCFEPETGEFWGGQFRSSSLPDADGIRDFVKSCIARVPAPFARDRIRFRMEADFFNEGVIRLLESKRVSYVIAAPDSPELRKLAKKCAFNGLSTGWEVGEFSQRLHPIRHTQARFVVLRRRLSKAADEAGRGTFRDDRHVYHVLATDRRGTPWRSFEIYAERPASVQKAQSLLAEFSTSPLLGRSRRSVAALFQAHLFASDLVQWFRRSCLPEEERAKGLSELRTGLLLVPPKSAGPRSLLVLPRRDPRRRLFSRVAHLTRRLRPARPFHFRP